MSEHYLGVVDIAEAMGVSRHAVHKWRSRYPADSTHPFPEPDIEVDGTPGWRPDRLPEVAAWREQLPGRGAGGGRPTAAAQPAVPPTSNPSTHSKPRRRPPQSVDSRPTEPAGAGGRLRNEVVAPGEVVVEGPHCDL